MVRIPERLQRGNFLRSRQTELFERISGKEDRKIFRVRCVPTFFFTDVRTEIRSPESLSKVFGAFPHKFVSQICGFKNKFCGKKEKLRGKKFIPRDLKINSADKKVFFGESKRNFAGKNLNHEIFKRILREKNKFCGKKFF
jgi:hypothetical protein